MILPDINILIHAYNSDFPAHAQARDWWEHSINGSEGIGLAWVTVLGFIRITTHARILTSPIPVEVACQHVEDWLSHPHVHLVEAAEGHFQRLQSHLIQLGTAGNLTTDAHLATLAMERGYVLYSADTDFHRFPGLRWRNPLTA